MQKIVVRLQTSAYNANQQCEYIGSCLSSMSVAVPAEMVEAAHQALADFVKNKEAAAVLIDSPGDKAFCAGVLLLISNVSKALHVTFSLWLKLCTISWHARSSGGDIRDIRQAVLDSRYDKDPPLDHRAARVRLAALPSFRQAATTKFMPCTACTVFLYNHEIH